MLRQFVENSEEDLTIEPALKTASPGWGHSLAVDVSSSRRVLPSTLSSSMAFDSEWCSERALQPNRHCGQSIHRLFLDMQWEKMSWSMEWWSGARLETRVQLNEEHSFKRNTALHTSVKESLGRSSLNLGNLKALGVMKLKYVDSSSIQ